ncbi:hypothetical protein CkaCkLH20_04913 [Colletotrichum karsti]|uniref:Uncharacterized protein n=1 Tax=Colletotrichum karsti TaxID=1095194 RepID=A0A9P6I5Q2_9PEZI|nr:uncharacterized protein CkaCkLH20_04913 [Colletotrichum karsti]KAF9877778.1 hypothetical protein CkaCkLH20_04913 [Colletotrichum karsti]
MSGLGIMNPGGAAILPRASPSLPNLKAAPLTTADASAFAHGCGRKDCFHDATSADCELHSTIVRDIIRSRREERRARLQQRHRTQSSSDEAAAMAAAAAAVSASRSVTPLTRHLSQSSKPDTSPRSTMSFDMSPCVSPLMEDLLLEVTDAIESSGLPPQVTMGSQSGSGFEMDDIFRLIEEAQREYGSLTEPLAAASTRFNVAAEPGWMREDCWGTVMGHS